MHCVVVHTKLSNFLSKYFTSIDLKRTFQVRLSRGMVLLNASELLYVAVKSLDFLADNFVF